MSVVTECLVKTLDTKNTKVFVIKNNNSIQLKFDNKTITCLAGFPYGKKIYEEQLKNMIDTQRNFTIGFPNHIIDVSSSFVQGLFSEIVKSIGLANTVSRLTIDSENERLKNRIKERL